jgi:hypothetical protein
MLAVSLVSAEALELGTLSDGPTTKGTHATSDDLAGLLMTANSTESDCRKSRGISKLESGLPFNRNLNRRAIADA